MELLDLPIDLLFEVFRHCDIQSLYTCITLSKSIHAFLTQNLEFQYAYRLDKQGLAENSVPSIPYGERLQILKDSIKPWDPSEPKRPYSTYHFRGDCIAYEFVGGVFAKTDGHSLTVQRLPTMVSEATQEQVTTSPQEIGFPIKDFAIDPSQDLIALIQAYDLSLFVPTIQDQRVKIHLRTLCARLPHPKAKSSTLTATVPPHPLGNVTINPTIQFSEDMLSLFFLYSREPGSPQLIIWDWREGIEVYKSMDINHYRSLPPLAKSFEFLSPRAYAIFSLIKQGTIYIYTISHPKKPARPPCLVTTLSLPTLPSGITTIRTHAGPFTAYPCTGSLFTTTEESRVYVVTVYFFNTIQPATIFIHHSAFTPYITSGGNRGPDRSLDVPWSVWSSGKTLITRHEISNNWLRYIHGRRVIMGYAPEESGRKTISIIDFDTHNIPQDLGVSIPEFSEIVQDDQFVKVHKVPLLTECSSFMIGEDCLLGLKTTGHFEDSIEHIEFYPMYTKE